MPAKRLPPRMATVQRDGDTVAAVALPLTGDRWQPAVLSSGASTLVGVGLLVKGEMLFGGLMVATFGPPTLMRLRTREARASLLLAESGIVSRTAFGAVDVPWDAVTGLGERSVSGARYVEVSHDGHVRRSGLLRWAGRVGLGARDRLWIALERVDADPDALAAAIARLHEDPAARRRIATGELAQELAHDANLTPASPR